MISCHVIYPFLGLRFLLAGELEHSTTGVPLCSCTILICSFGVHRGQREPPLIGVFDLVPVAVVLRGLNTADSAFLPSK